MDFDSMSIEDLVLAWQSSQKDARLSDEIHRRLFRFVIDVANKYGGSPEIQAAAAYGLVRALHRWTPNRSKVTTYAFYWIRREAVRALNREVAAISPGDMSTAPDPVIGPDTSAERREDIDLLHEQINRLDPVDAAMLRAVYFENRTGAEVAARFGFGRTNAYRRLAHAKDKLCKRLKSVGLHYIAD